MSNAAQRRQPSGHMIGAGYVGVATELGVTPRVPHGAYTKRLTRVEYDTDEQGNPRRTELGPLVTPPHPLDILVFLHMEREMRKGAKLVGAPGNYGFIDILEQP